MLHQILFKAKSSFNLAPKTTHGIEDKKGSIGHNSYELVGW